MSVKLTFVSSGDGGGISRSCSFTGFSTVQSRKLAKSLSRSSVRSRMSLKFPKAYSSLQKGAVIWDPKPLQVKKIFEALKKGLNEYLEAHQAELDCLSDRHKDTKRNSRLAFYYDLDKKILKKLIKFIFSLSAYLLQKQIRSVERYIRKLEFHISKVREFYLDMCFIEGALEVHLGEFHLKMKGLVGFARLCPGDQYEVQYIAIPFILYFIAVNLLLRNGYSVLKAKNALGYAGLTSSLLCDFQVFVRLGRQKWRLKGKIESDDSQTWDEEEKIFIPNLHEQFEIKVTELRGLATVPVGVVMCDSINFFTPKPQAIVVDITELGTIKLQLEVLWNPFDTENLFLSPGTTAKFSVGSRKSSLYNWTPPSTPSFREKYYPCVLQRRLNQGDVSDEAQPPSILSYLAACDFGAHEGSKPHNPAETSEGDSFSSEDQRGTGSSITGPAPDHRTLPLVIIQETCAEEQHPLPNHATLDILKKTPCVDTFPSDPSSFLSHGKGSRRLNQSRNRHLTEQESISQKSLSAADDVKPDGLTKSIDKTLQEVLNLLKFHHVGQAQLEKLEYQVLTLRDKLKVCTYNDNTLQSLSCDTKTETRDVTTGDDNLDVLLITHLKLCKALLQKLRSPHVARIVQENVLEEVSEQLRVLGDILDMSAQEIIQKTKKKKHYMKIWSDLAEPGSVLFASADRLHHALKYTLAVKVKEKYPGQLEAVLRRLLEQIVTCDGLLPPAHPHTEPVTLFQFCGYLEKHQITSLEKHVGKLAKEVMLIEELQCPGRLKTLKKLKGKRLSGLQPLPQSLRLLGVLQLDENHRVSKAATSCLSRAAANKNFREKVRATSQSFSGWAWDACDCCVSQQCSYPRFHRTFLKQGIESIEQVAHLCQSETEDVRNAARETTLSFGEKGRQAFEKMDRICCELRDTVQQEAEIEITVF
ncbi:hypothetical protein ASZ78_003187 [Callipepla squamata]|uniref:FAM65 N-terminal domain-containing protein n=1 Tax=Callipepla squamata TaxID=9009 RepID=A0A226N337_CALSU|nr:hypothetical protein ASZ78_003187 [Callipepla squamata]